MKFADKDRHQVFIEPEGLDTNEMYIGGMSSSLPEDVQYEMYRSVPGLEHARLSVMPMRSNMIVLMPDSSMRRWNLKRSAGCSAEDNLTEVLDMRRQQHKDLWQVLMQQGKYLEKSRSL